MKLIHILARELKVWPVSVEAIEQDIYGRGLYEYQGPPIKENVSEIAEDAKNAFVTRAQWQAAIEAIADQNSETPWNGEGLPPVGEAVCEYLGAHQYDVWTVVNIFAEWGEGSRKVVFVDFGDLDGWRAERDPERFRPIRTAEQIAAEERAKEITRLSEITGLKVEAYKTVFEAIIDSDYRKEAACTHSAN